MSFTRVSALFLTILSCQIAFASDAVSHRIVSDYIHVVEIDPTQLEIAIVEAEDGIETVSSMAERSHAFLAINGGFFQKSYPVGTPSGVLKIEGEWRSPTDRERGAIGFSNDPSLVAIDRLNEDFAPILNEDSRDLWESFPFVLGTTPVLIYKGEKVDNLFEESLPARFVYERFNRTAIGLLPNNHWVLVVMHQPGMTLYELQDFMLSLGAQYAINLCGSSTATLYYEGKVFTYQPGIEQKVANAIVFSYKE